MNKQQRNRLIVANGLLFLLIVSSTIFGPNVFLIAGLGLATSFVVEILNSKFRKEHFDWTTALITPLIITLLTTPTIIDEIWMVAVATAFGVFFAKSVFGGEGKNVFNPATVGLIFVALAFPSYINNFLDPISGLYTTSTPAGIFKDSPDLIFNTYSLWDLLMGNYAGAIGTTFKLGILIYGAILMAFKISDWKIPLTFLGSYFLIGVLNYLILGHGMNSLTYAFYSLFMGHLLFGAMFVATDPYTTPLYTKGKIIFGLSLGLITWIIQNIWIFNPTAPNTEGIIYSITFMNAVVGLIDVWTVPKMKDIPVLEEVTI